MSIDPDDLDILISQYRTMDIEELQVNIEHLEEETSYSNQLQSLNIAKNELALKYKESQEQIELLTKSLTSSSRFERWISSSKASSKTV